MSAAVSLTDWWENHASPLTKLPSDGSPAPTSLATGKKQLCSASCSNVAAQQQKKWQLSTLKMCKDLSHAFGVELAKRNRGKFTAVRKTYPSLNVVWRGAAAPRTVFSVHWISQIASIVPVVVLLAPGAHCTRPSRPAKLAPQEKISQEASLTELLPSRFPTLNAPVVVAVSSQHLRSWPLPVAVGLADRRMEAAVRAWAVPIQSIPLFRGQGDACQSARSCSCSLSPRSPNASPHHISKTGSAPCFRSKHRLPFPPATADLLSSLSPDGPSHSPGTAGPWRKLAGVHRTPQPAFWGSLWRSDRGASSEGSSPQGLWLQTPPFCHRRCFCRSWDSTNACHPLSLEGRRSRLWTSVDVQTRMQHFRARRFKRESVSYPHDVPDELGIPANKQWSWLPACLGLWALDH